MNKGISFRFRCFRAMTLVVVVTAIVTFTLTLRCHNPYNPIGKGATFPAISRDNGALAWLYNKGRLKLESFILKWVHPVPPHMQGANLSDTINDCKIDFGTVDEATTRFFQKTLLQLQTCTFFDFFKVDLTKSCPFWEENGQCFMRDCSVCECDAELIPKKWLREDEMLSTAQRQGHSSGSVVEVMEGDSCATQMRKEEACSNNEEIEKEFGHVDTTHTSFEAGDLIGWSEDDDVDATIYVNLGLNPEKFTGYSGASAWKVWHTIYQENCFDGCTTTSYDSNCCREKRVFFRLISGLQSSIMTQISLDYRFENGRCGRNMDLFLRSVGSHPDRVNNLYFTYLFLLRALAKATPILKHYDYATGHAEGDAKTAELMKQVLDCVRPKSKGSDSYLAATCMAGFDESDMFNEPGNGDIGPMKMREQFVHKFQNISRIMDCVGCEKCKLWGKLEVLGIGTSIRMILASEAEIENGTLSLSRNEVIALVNTAAQLGKSVASLPSWRALTTKDCSVRSLRTGVSAGVLALCAVSALIFACNGLIVRKKKMA